jgi:hypothetical protein
LQEAYYDAAQRAGGPAVGPASTAALPREDAVTLNAVQGANLAPSGWANEAGGEPVWGDMDPRNWPGDAGGDVGPPGREADPAAAGDAGPQAWAEAEPVKPKSKRGRKKKVQVAEPGEEGETPVGAEIRAEGEEGGAAEGPAPRKKSGAKTKAEVVVEGEEPPVKKKRGRYARRAGT